MLLISAHGWDHLANTWFLLFFKKASRYVLQIRSNKRKGCFLYWLWFSFSISCSVLCCICFKHGFVCLPWWMVRWDYRLLKRIKPLIFTSYTQQHTSFRLCAPSVLKVNWCFHLIVMFMIDYILICDTHVWSQFKWDLCLFHSPDRVWIVDQSYLSPPMGVSSPPWATRESPAVTACPHSFSYLPSDKVSPHTTWRCFSYWTGEA